MLCSAHELGMGDDADGIIELNMPLEQTLQKSLALNCPRMI